MRLFSLSVALLLCIGAVGNAQEPTDPAPPPEIVVPGPGEQIPPPGPSSPSDVKPKSANGKSLRPGDIVVGDDIPLYPRVRIKHAHDMAPNAVPTIVAVMHPQEGPWHPHHRHHHWRHHRERKAWPAAVPLVFVKIMAPPTAPHSVHIDDEEVELRYGRHEVELDSEDGIVTIEYDDD